MNNLKQLNIETWSVEHVCQWLKGVTSVNSLQAAKCFKENRINGKKLSVLDFNDLNEFLNCEYINLSNQLLIFKSIQNLLEMKHDLNKESLHTLIFNVKNRLVSLLNFVHKLENCPCCFNEKDCEKCFKIKNYDMISGTSALSLKYRKLISWLVRIPFTRLKPFEKFREEINAEMKIFLKSFRKRSSENFIKEITARLKSMLDCCNRILDYCDKKCHEENGKISVAFSCCYLEKVIINQRNANQILGIKLTSLLDGIYTIAEIARESAADECSQLNVEDDIICVNNQIVIGWNSHNILNLLEESFNSTRIVSLIVRKMPKDHLNSIKQQKNLVFIYKNPNQTESKKKKQLTNKETQNSQHQRNLSFSDILISDDLLIEDSSDEDEDNYDHLDKNNNILNNKDSLNDLTCMPDKQSSTTGKSKSRKFSIENLFEKKSKKHNEKISSPNVNKMPKLAKKSNKSRLIKSMQNLFFYDRSRSNSVENLDSGNETKKTNSSSKSSIENDSDSKSGRTKSTEESNPSPHNGDSKSEIFKSIFSNKRWDLSSNNNLKKKPIELNNFEAPDTPNLLNVKKVDSVKRYNMSSQSALLEEQINASSKMVSSKPPLDKRYKIQSQKPFMQGWLYKQKQSSSSAASSTTSSTSSLSSMSSSNQASSMTSSINSNDSYVNLNKNTHSLLRNHISRGAKWKRYWCVLMKDYITFYKNSDEKTPKDFLLLKDFEIKESKQKYGFVITDKAKQYSHEFYTDHQEEFHEWFQAFIDLRNRLNGEPINSLSSTSLSSGYETISSLMNQINRDDVSICSLNNSSVSSQSLPSSSTMSRKNNLQLQLSTILDDDQNVNLQNSNSTKHSQASANQSPIYINENLQKYNSSRETSPDISNNNSKLASRDSSPGFNYNYQHEQDVATSESDGEMYSKTLSPENCHEFFKENKSKINLKNTKNVSHLSKIAAAAATTAANIPTAGINNFKKQMSSSPSPASAKSINKFVYDCKDNDIKNIKEEREEDEHNESESQYQPRCNSLPGSLQACVGSYLVNNSNYSKYKSAHKRNASTTSNKIQQNNSENSPIIPVETKASAVTTSLNTCLANSTVNTSIQIQKPVVNPLLGYHNQIQQQQSQFNYFYQQPQQKVEQVASQSPTSKTTKISFQLGGKRSGQLNTFNFIPQQSQIDPHSFHLTKMTKATQIPSISIPAPNSPSIVYRTEMTIHPSSFNNTTNSGSINNSQYPSSLPKYAEYKKNKI